jgi:site-specific recombinase XerD
MTPLRKRYIEDLKLAGYSRRTIGSYVYSVSKLAQYFSKSPQHITNEELRNYLLYHKDKYASNTTTMALCAIKHLFEKTLQRTMPIFNLTRQKKKNNLPFVLSKEEVRLFLNKTKLLRYRALFTILYCCGLRLNEALNLTVNTIDSKRMTLKVVNDKGGVDIRIISEYLGHKSLETTLIYTHLTPLLRENTYDKISHLMNDLK